MIRSLKPGEPVPAGPPRRYLNTQGYYRLRWKVGPRQYVECYEHRVIDGKVTTAEHVHHLNHDKTDNRPENLRPISAREHATHHGIAHRKVDLDKAVEMYRQGHGTPVIGRALGVHPVTVYRALRRHGVEMRGIGELVPNRIDGLDAQVLDLLASGLRSHGIAARLGVSRGVVRRILREHGIVFPPGRPPARRSMSLVGVTEDGDT